MASTPRCASSPSTASGSPCSTAREAGHFAAIGERLAELGSLVTGLGSAVRDQAAILAAPAGPR